MKSNFTKKERVECRMKERVIRPGNRDLVFGAAKSGLFPGVNIWVKTEEKRQKYGTDPVKVTQSISLSLG